MTRRYTLSALLSAVKHPSLFVNEGEYLLSKFLFRTKYGSGIDVMAKDWDNLIILDACRADYFTEHNEIDGKFEEVISRGSNSTGFIDTNFTGRELHDTIYITANPFVERLSDDVFFRVHYSELFGQWDEELRTIPPDAVVEATLQMHERYPDKRLITHFMQPHAPYLGPTGRELHKSENFGVFNPNLKERGDFDVPEAGIPQAIKKGYVREDELKQAYDENVQIAVESAEELVNQLNGKSVITADHGEMLGERLLVSKKYGHGDYYHPALRVVPWFSIDSDDRRDVTEGEPKGFSQLEDNVREDRLKALGYA